VSLQRIFLTATKINALSFHFISTVPLSFVQQVVFKNIGRVERQFPPGVNVTAVGVDVYVEGAAMQCYKDMSTSLAANVCIQSVKRLLQLKKNCLSFISDARACEIKLK